MSPAEGSAYRLALKDRKEFPDIFTLGTKTRPYYTSLLVPPSQPISLIERLQIEEQILPLFTGGTACRVYIGEKRPNTDSMQNFIHKMANSKIPYFDITATFSICMDSAKKFRGVHYECPECSKPADVFQRVVGYYRSENKANAGKKQEIADRLYVGV
jgi:ribonucleoside-triphosphate reductase